MGRGIRAIFLSFLLFSPIHRILHAASPDSRDTDSPFGVLEFLPWDDEWNRYHYAGDKPERAVALMKEAGVGMVRLDFLWQDIEPSRGKFDFRKHDRLVQLLSDNGIKILGMLQYNVSWASSHWNEAPHPALFANYARAVAERYKDRVKYWEIWNEPDSTVYWMPPDGMKSYTLLLKEVYPVLKEADPTCRVVLGGFAQAHSIRLRQVYKNGGKDYFDVVSFHPFVDPLMPNAMQILKGYYLGVYKEMVANGDEKKPIWLTEIGCPGAPPSAPGWWFGKNPDEEAQARWMAKVYKEPLKWPGVEKIFWAFFRDTPNHFGNGADYLGMVREDFTPKEAFETYKAKAASHQKITSLTTAQ